MDFEQGDLQMAIFGYGRVSRKDQTAENQRLEVERKYLLDFWFADEGVSGAVEAFKRPEFSHMLQQIRRGETLVVSKLDRLGRNAIDIGATLRDLEGRGVKVIVVQLGEFDMTSPTGKVMITMLSAVAELERDLIIERTQAGLERAKAQGKRLGRRPRLSKLDKEVLRQRVAAGVSISQLARELDVSRATILRAVKGCDQ